MATLPLTEKQEKLWRFIASCERSPTYSEMCEAADTKSIGSIRFMVNLLEKRGLVRRTPGRWRSTVACLPERGTLDAWTDAELIEELERRTEAANKRADAMSSIGAPKSEPVKLYHDWRDGAREASAQLLHAIEQAGVRP